MKNERILSYKMSEKLSVEDVDNVSAATGSCCTYETTYSSSGGDVSIDF